MKSKENEDKKDKQKGEKDNCEEWKEKYLRLHAEFDNFRKQMDIDKKNAKVLGSIKVLEVFVDLLDDLDRAEHMLAKVKDNTKMKEGIDILIKRMKSSFEKLGVKEVDILGKYADPSICEVVGSEQSDKEQGTVLKVMRKGYLYDTYLIRPAMVVVSSGKSN